MGWAGGSIFSTMNTDGLLESDQPQLAAAGIPLEEVERQLALFRSPPAGVRLVRPCRRGDGVRVLSGSEETLLLETWREASRKGRFSKFVPASGAASRMFQSLASFLDTPPGSPAELAAAGSVDARDVLRFQTELERFAFAADVRAESDIRDLLRFVLGREGLGLADRPKGLIPFHRTPDGSRTPFEEHLVEAAATIRAEDGRCRLHFTVSPEALDEFRSLLESRRGPLERALDASFDVSFSVQLPSTDTIAVDLENRPFRLADGSLLFRPGGHGALLANLANVGQLGGDLVYLKNIDNVVPESRLPLVARWKRLLGGLAVALEQKVHSLQRALEVPGCTRSVLEEAATFLAATFGATPPTHEPHEGLCRTLRGSLARPIRVVGMVKNEGEPGGGPFWVAGQDGAVTPQIVESSEVDVTDPRQKEIWAASTHFNPVDLVAALRDVHGQPYDLAPFVDPTTVFISRKSRDGRDLKALELPGLWNGAMAGWNTVFVEVPVETFAPVKTVLDLLRPEHQA